MSERVAIDRSGLDAGEAICGLTSDCVITTPRLRMRSCRIADARHVHAIFADWEVVQWLGAPSWPQPLSETRAYLEAVMSGYVQIPERYLMIERDGELVGGIAVRDHPANHLQCAPGPHIGYWLGRAFWGRGLMTEAAGGVIARVFAAYPAPAIYSGVFEENAASLRVQEKLGFVRDGMTTLACNPRGGVALPHVNTVLSRARFEALAR